MHKSNKCIQTYESRVSEIGQGYESGVSEIGQYLIDVLQWFFYFFSNTYGFILKIKNRPPHILIYNGQQYEPHVR